MGPRTAAVSFRAGAIRQFLAPAAALIVFGAALVVLRLELVHTNWRQVWADVARIPPARFALAGGLTAASYVALTGYDFLALASIGRRLPRARVALASFVSYAVSHTVGLTMLSGASLRYRFYTRSGISAGDLSRIIVSYSLTFWLGLCALGGLGLSFGPLPAILPPPARIAFRALGWFAMAAVVLLFALRARRRAPIRIRAFEVPIPRFTLAASQLVVSVADWALAGAVLFVLIPAGVPFPAFLTWYLCAIVIGLASHVPGGLGVFESSLAWLLSPYIAPTDLWPALVVYRVTYYLLPFAVAVVCLVADEVYQRRQAAARMSAWLARISGAITPGLAGLLAFIAGLVLLLSGATPAAAGRLERLGEFLPVGAIEASNFLGSVLGALLLVLSQGLARRLDAAFYLAVTALAAGIATSLLKGLDYEEALILGAILGVLITARPAFSRRAAFFETRFSPAWTATLLAALASAVWLGLFAFKHVAYSDQLWWQFELRGEASRALRAGVGASLVMLIFGATRLLKPAPPDVAAPTDADLADADRIIQSQSATTPNLAFLRDKGLIFNDARTAFLMYGVQGRTWVAMGDPVGPAMDAPDLIRQFLERADDFAGTPVFYQVGPDQLHRYADVGLVSVKLGEEAVVDLKALTFAGLRGKRFRQALRRLEPLGAVFEVVPAERVESLLPQLAEVSQAWLSDKRTGEKGFSLGFFDATYLTRFPVALIRRAGRIEAFANVWAGADRVELSVDLMRYRRDAPDNVMETLLVHLMKWGQDQGYARFALGMAPLSGLAASPAASHWTRVGRFLYRHGGSVYNFRGLRTFKEKFGPEWQPRYLAYPGTVALPRVLADVTALIAGGYRRLFRS